jgi:hypothetical protein
VLAGLLLGLLKTGQKMNSMSRSYSRGATR